MSFEEGGMRGRAARDAMRAETSAEVRELMLGTARDSWAMGCGCLVGMLGGVALLAFVAHAGWLLAAWVLP